MRFPERRERTWLASGTSHPRGTEGEDESGVQGEIEPGFMLLAVLLALPLVGPLVFLLLPRERLSVSVSRWLSLLITGSSLAILAYLTFFTPERAEFFLPWMPAFGLNFSLWLDGPAMFFAWLVLGIGFLIFFYSGYYLDPEDSPWRFYGTMVLFMGSMLGVVISRNAILMFVFWEMTSITSFILIGHWHEKKSARMGALQALIVTGTGGLVLLAGLGGVLWISIAAGIDPARAMEWDILWENREVLTSHPASLVVLILVLIGAFSKSAQFPFQFWLPGAMEAPTPVSAFLHAATMVKAGIYLLGRLYPVYADFAPWLAIVGSVGVITMGIGGFMALTSTDLKQLLAHSTVSQLGLLTAYYGFGYGRMGTEHPIPLDLLLIASHAMFKGALFMLVGVIDHGCHTREWTRLGGLRRVMPATTILTILGCASMAGVPLTFGFVAKELFLKASLDLHTHTALLKYGLPAGAILTSVFTVAYCVRMSVSPFFGKPRDKSIHAHEGSLGFLLAPGILIGLCVLGGLYVPLIEGPLAAMTNSAFYGTHSHFSVAFFHHIDKLLLIAVFLFGVGTLLFLASNRIRRFYESSGSPAIFRWTYEGLFLHGSPAFAEWLTGLSQVPSLQRNVTRVLGVSFVAIALAMTLSGSWDLPLIPFDPVEQIELLLIPMLAVSLWVVMTHEIALIRILAMAPVGLFVILAFFFFEAPDLALTQILVEVAMLIVLLILLLRLPQKMTRTKPTPPLGRVLRLAVAFGGAAIMASLSYTGFSSEHRDQPTFPHDPTVKEYYLQNSKHAYPEHHHDMAHAYPGESNPRSGGGNNVVNVILVDFRGIDTMGEVTVLGLAAMGVLCLFALKRKRRGEDEHKVSLTEVRRIVTGYVEGELPPPVLKRPMWPSPSLILSEAARLVPALMLLFGVVLFLAGHNTPGGGFIAGLMVSVGFTLLLLAFRKKEVRAVHNRTYLQFIPVGLTFAVGTGLVAVAFGAPFLTSAHHEFHLPGGVGVELASAVAFDFGVFLIVVGTLMLIIERLARE